MKYLIYPIFITILVSCSNNKSMVNSVVADSSLVNNGMLYSLPKQLVKVNYTRKGIGSKKAKKVIENIEAKKQNKITSKKALETKVKMLGDNIKNLNPHIEHSATILAKYQKEILDLKTQILVITNSLLAIQNDLKIARYNYKKSLELGTVYVESFKISAEKPIADDTLTFNANLDHEKTRSDSFNLSIKDGLLDGAIASTEDKTGGILSTLAGGLSGLTNFQNYNIKTLTLNPRQSTSVLSACEKEKNISVSQIIDPDDQDDYIVLNRKLHAGCISLCVKSPLVTLKNNSNLKKGLVYRSSATYKFQIERQDSLVSHDISSKCNTSSNALDIMRINLVQGGSYGVISMPKGRFSKNKYDVSFSKGMLVKNDITRPSEYLGAAMILPNILREIISIPAELIQLRVNYSTSEKDLIELQQAMITAQYEIEKKQQELDLLLIND